MHKAEFDAVIKLSSDKRYEYFVKRVVDFEEMWGLFADGWAMTESENKKSLLPLWPFKEFAEHFANEEWKGYKPENIKLDEFINEWIPGLAGDKVEVAVFWNRRNTVTVPATHLLMDLNRVIEDF